MTNHLNSQILPESTALAISPLYLAAAKIRYSDFSMSNKKLPLVSIVMPSLNQAQFIEASIESVLNQSYTNLELIIADGDSKDQTLDLLNAYQSKDKRVHYFSRQDTGPANAINQALAQVRGTLIGWLNSDDLYAEGSILTAVQNFQKTTSLLMLYGEGEHINQQGKRLNRYPTLPASTSIQQFKEGCFICQPTVFFKYSLFKLLGNLDENLQTAFDFDYWLRAFSAFPERIASIDRIQAYSRLHDNCITLRMQHTATLEAMHVLTQYLGYAPKHWLLSYFNLKSTQFKTLKDFEEHLYSTLNTAENYLTINDFSQIKAEIPRLLLEKMSS